MVLCAMPRATAARPVLRSSSRSYCSVIGINQPDSGWVILSTMIDSAGGFPRIKWEAPRHVSVPISTRFSPLLMRACPPVTKKALLSSQPLCNSSGCRTVWASVAMELIALFTKSVRTADVVPPCLYLEFLLIESRYC